MLEPRRRARGAGRRAGRCEVAAMQGEALGPPCRRTEPCKYGTVILEGVACEAGRGRGSWRYLTGNQRSRSPYRPGLPYSYIPTDRAALGATADVWFCWPVSGTLPAASPRPRWWRVACCTLHVAVCSIAVHVHVIGTTATSNSTPPASPPPDEALRDCMVPQAPPIVPAASARWTTVPVGFSGAEQPVFRTAGQRAPDTCIIKNTSGLADRSLILNE